jgi:L-ribulose-5-phosphate 4-epimerase
MTPRESAVDLARFLGDPALDCAILAEGNVSAREDETSFWVKASGFEMRQIQEDGFVRVRFEPIADALRSDSLDDGAVKTLLSSATVQGDGKMPSVETFMHAYLLTLPNVNFVGHGHPTALLSLLSTGRAHDISRQRLFPDEVVCCGPAAAFVPYMDPGLPLARRIAQEVEIYVNEFGQVPKTIWMENHGLIALGQTISEVKTITAMSVKAARVWLGALSTGQMPRPLPTDHVERIQSRPDEHYRQNLLREVQARKPLQ